MAAESESNLRLEIGHVLFIDLVGYSKLLIEEQKERLRTLTHVVLATAQVREATNEQLVRLPTGDGMALVFRNSSEEPARCALEIAQALKEHPEIPVRMGIHSGPVSEVTDVNGRTNIAGAGINTAQRAMDCGDAGHILLSQHVADDLAQYRQWSPRLHDLGECEVKHGVRLRVVNLYTEEIGNPALPEKFKHVRGKKKTIGAISGPIAKATNSKRPMIIAAVVLASALAIGVMLFAHKPSPKPARIAAPAPLASAIPEKSIAVLPFENLSRDPDNAFFADGVQDVILTELAKIADLKVISRTSVMEYKSGIARNLREIGKQLGVAHLLEGSVQRAGGKVRVNAQLIDARTDGHLWAENYDRPLDDIFAIQSEIAKTIADHLRAKLSPAEKTQIEHKPTENSDAYLLYLQAHELFTRPDYVRDDWFKAEQLLKDAIKLDAKFASAFAELARVENLIYHFYQPTPSRSEKAMASLNEALRLQPDLPLAHLALGYYYYYVDSDYERALSEFDIARRSLPNNSEIYMAIGAIERRQGKWAQSTANFEKAASLDPKDASLLQELATTYWHAKNYEAVDKILDRGLQVAPQSFSLRGMKAWLAVTSKGDLSLLEKELDNVPPGTDPALVTSGRTNLLFLQRKFPQALAVLQEWPGEAFDGPYGTRVPKTFLQGFSYLEMKDETKARVVFEDARRIVERSLRETPSEVRLSDASRHALLGKILAFLGQKERAIAEGKRAVELLPESKDAMDGPSMTKDLAQIYAWTGEKNLALQLLEHSLSTSGGITASLLRLDPVWDPLRGDPRFEKLASQK